MSNSSSCSDVNCTSTTPSPSTSPSSSLSTPSAANFFAENLQFFVYGFVVAGLVLLLIVLFLFRLRYDRSVRRRYAYESEFDVRKEMQREAKKKARLAQKQALIKAAKAAGVPIHTLGGQRLVQPHAASQHAGHHHAHRGPQPPLPVHPRPVMARLSWGEQRPPGRGSRSGEDRRPGMRRGSGNRAPGHEADGEETEPTEDTDGRSHPSDDEGEDHSVEDADDPDVANLDILATTRALHAARRGSGNDPAMQTAEIAPSPAPPIIRPLQLNNLVS